MSANGRLSRRRLLASLGTAATVAGAGCLGRGAESETSDETPTPERSSLELLLDWKANAAHAGGRGPPTIPRERWICSSTPGRASTPRMTWA